MTEQQVRETLVAHGVPESILAVWGDMQSPLRYFSFNKPNFSLAEALEDLVPGLRGLCPIFEQNGEAVIGYLPQGGRFIRYYYEDGQEGDAAIELLGLGYQQFVSSILLKFEEAGMSEYFDELVSVLHFKRGAEFRGLLDADPYDEGAVEDFHSKLAVGQ